MLFSLITGLIGVIYYLEPPGETEWNQEAREAAIVLGKIAVIVGPLVAAILALADHFNWF